MGYTKGQGRRSNGFGSLVLGVNEGGELRWAGNVGTGFDDAEIKRLLALLKPLRRDNVAVCEVPRCRRCARTTVSGSSRSSSRSPFPPSGRTTDGCGRRSTWDSGRQGG